MTQGSHTPLGLHLQLEDEQGRGRDRSQGYHRGCSSAERIGQQGPYSATHRLLSHEQTLAATSHQDILSTCFPVSWTNRGLAELANKPRLFSTIVPGPAEPRVPSGVYSIQCLLHSEDYSQPHIPLYLCLIFRLSKKVPAFDLHYRIHRVREWRWRVQPPASSFSGSRTRKSR